MTHGGEGVPDDAAPGALESAMRIPGAVAASFGDLGSGRVLGSTSRPAQTGGLLVPLGKMALGIAMGAVADFGGARGNGGAETSDPGANAQAVEEVIITGPRYFCLWQAARLSSGEWHAFIQISLDRSKANLAMARLDLRAVAECLPGAVEYHRRLDASARAPASARVEAEAGPVSSPPSEEGENLPRREPGRQIPGSVPAAAAKQVSELTLRQILWGLRRYR